MATVSGFGKVKHPGRQRIEHALERGLYGWSRVPMLAEQWSSWDNDTRLAIEVDWPIEDDLLLQLQGWADSGMLDATQQRRYRELAAIADCNRPVIERLFDQIKSETTP